MSTPEADEPGLRRPTGVGWPDASPPEPEAAPKPAPEPEAAPKTALETAPKPAPAPPHRASQRRELAAERDATVELPRQTGPASDFASRAQAYRARSTLTQPPYPVEPERPGTVTAAAVIMFVSAGLGLLACCGLNVLAGEATLGDDEQNLLLLFSALIVVFSLFNGVLGYYVLQGRQWARVTTIGLCALGILASIVELFVAVDGPGGGVSTCFGIALNAVLIGLLAGSSAGHYFRHARG